MDAYLPPGWPHGVHPPGSEDFERTAQAWLIETVPADYRLHGVLRRYPLALAAMAAHHTRACVAGARDGYRTARTELGHALPAHALEAVLAAYRAEGRRLVETAHAVDLVARALRGEVFTPQLHDAPQTAGRRDGAGAATTTGPGTTADSRRRDPGPDPRGGTPGRGGGPEDQPGTGPAATDPAARDELSARRMAAGAGGEAPAKRAGRDGAVKTRKAPAAQRPTRDGETARRKSRPSDKHVAAG